MKSLYTCLILGLNLSLLGCASNQDIAPSTQSPSKLLSKPQVLTPSGSNWGLRFNIKNLKTNSEKGNIKQGYHYMGEGDGITISYFVEPAKKHKNSNNHGNPAMYYWLKAIRYPLIDQSTVKLSKTNKYSKAEYFYTVNKMKNVNYYIAHNGYWIDVHISISNYTPKDEAKIRKFEESLDIVAF